jgi:DNA-binding MarR family transcriptional regulator
MIGALLRMPAEAVRRRMLEHLRARGFDGLEAAHLNVFQYPGPEGARPSELAAELGMSKQALNYMLGELERLGYLERLPDPEDTRSKRIALTARGSAAVKTMLDAVRAVERDWRRELGAKEFEQLRALLLDLNDRL